MSRVPSHWTGPVAPAISVACAPPSIEVSEAAATATGFQRYLMRDSRK